MHTEREPSYDVELSDEQAAAVDYLTDAGRLDPYDARKQVLSSERYISRKSSIGASGLRAMRNQTGPIEVIQAQVGDSPFYQVEFDIDGQISEQARQKERLLEIKELQDVFVAWEIRLGYMPDEASSRRRAEDRSIEELKEAITKMSSSKQR